MRNSGGGGRSVFRNYLLPAFVATLLAGSAISQEIVIEPTNGRPQSTSRVSRPQPSVARHGSVREPRTRVVERNTSRGAAAPKQARGTVAEKNVRAAVPAPEIVDDRENTPQPRKATPARPEWALVETRDASSVQNEIVEALARDPKLASSAITVRVDESSITLSGLASGTDERLQAERLAQSYVWNRKLIDRLEVTGVNNARK